MTLPNFIVIGAAKSGTTALYHYLKSHPQIFMSPLKEPRFFAFDREDLQFCGPGDAELHRSTILDLAAYQSLFGDIAGETAVGEASPVYLCSPKAAEKIRALLPQAKLIAILRHPVERAYSHYLHLIRDGVEPLADFAQALAAEPQRVRDNWEYRWRYKELGFYSSQLGRFFACFDRSRIRIYLYEEFDRRPERVLRNIYRFLEVDEHFITDTSVRYNTSGVPRSKIMHAMLSKLQKATQGEAAEQSARSGKLGRSALGEKARRIGLDFRNRNLVKPRLAHELRVQLLADYREDILVLQDLIRRDLSRWLI